MTNTDEIRYRILKALNGNPYLTQRGLAKELGISLGKANFCLNALIARGWVKARNFQKSNNKCAYSYVLTPSGLEAKAKVAARFLKHKMDEYETIRKVIEELEREAMQDSSPC
ncbi:MAG: MarR family EPS-associated transcriptional regulator [Gammaproteobacteria bacterium]|nr:MarR family EPS-associated transcriptional regulator [Gammaproteobacteria bacterium]